MKTKNRILITALLLLFVTNESNGQHWELLGNAGTNPPTNFLGTTDVKPLVFKTAGTEWMRILTNGRTGIGLNTPPSRLSVLCNATTKNDGISVNRTDVHTCIFNQPVTNAGVIQVYSQGTANTIGNTQYMLQLQPEGGHVGIGVNSVNPPSRLSIACNLTVKTDGLSINRGDVHTCMFNQPVTNDGVLQVYSGGSTGVIGNNPYVLQLQPEGGNVGIGLTTQPTAKLTIKGNVLIGDPTVVTLPGTYGLYVQNGILSYGITVAVPGTSFWADFVFDKNYKLKNINEVEAFIKCHKHLPNIPSANEVVEKGIDMLTMDAKLLEKIEELTLYIIEQNKRIEILEQKECDERRLKSSPVSLH